MISLPLAACPMNDIIGPVTATNRKPRDTQMNQSQVKTVATYFRGNAKYGRTTTLVSKTTGEKLGEWMGCLTKKDCLAQLRTA